MSHTNELKTFVNNFYGKADIKKSDFAPVIELMQFDKKNINGKVNFVLLNQLENCLIDVQVTDDLLLEGLEYFIK